MYFRPHDCGFGDVSVRFRRFQYPLEGMDLFFEFECVLSIQNCTNLIDTIFDRDFTGSLKLSNSYVKLSTPSILQHDLFSFSSPIAQLTIP